MAIVNSQRPLLSAHPAHYLLTALLLLSTLVLYHRQPIYPAITRQTFATAGSQQDLTLAQRLARSEQIFQRSRAQRQELTDKFGANPASYPADSAEGPWPAMTVWDFLYPSFNCPHEVERIGATGDGGKWVCGLSRIENKASCVIYSFGINLESSFEAGMMSRSKCEVWGYDFSVDSFGPEIPASLSSRTHFYKWGLDGRDNHNGNPPMYTLESLMKLNGHTFIDVLKIDIETSEFAVLDDVMSHYKGRPLPFGQLLLEIHAWNSHFEKAMTLVKWFSKLENAGLRPFFYEPNLVYMNYNRDKAPELSEYSFINVLGKHELVTG